MLCNNCRVRPAKHIYFLETNGNREKILLCDECFGELNAEALSVGNLFTGLFKDIYMADAPVEKICKTCGARLSEFNESGLVGCKDCYKAFSAEIMGAIKKMQGKTVHTGKRPGGGAVK